MYEKKTPKALGDRRKTLFLFYARKIQMGALEAHEVASEALPRPEAHFSRCFRTLYWRTKARPRHTEEQQDPITLVRLMFFNTLH